MLVKEIFKSSYASKLHIISHVKGKCLNLNEINHKKMYISVQLQLHFKEIL